MTDTAVPGRALVEAGDAVAGSMARPAAALLFDDAGARVTLDPRLGRCLRRAAAAAGELPGARERVRVGAAIAFAVELAVTRGSQGRPVRTDGFFTAGSSDRSPADELTEAALRSAREASQEWRVRHLGYLLAETAVSAELDAGLVHRALRDAANLTARQLVLLAAVGRRDRVPLPMAPLPVDPDPWTAWGALADLSELQERGLLDPPPATPRPGSAPLPRLRLVDLRPTRRGVLLHRLLALDFVRDEAISAVLADLGLTG